MDAGPVPTVPLAHWTPLHPAAARWPVVPPAGETPARPRDLALAAALARRNEGWGNPVEEELRRWREGAAVVVAGQQPGLLGGPLLSLVKACAVAAEVRRRREAGQAAVGFFWLSTSDDDLAEMGWGRVVEGEEVRLVQEGGWRRGDAVAGHATLSGAAAEFLAALAERSAGERAREAVAWARQCFAPGERLGEACGRFLGRLLRGLGVVLVDALEPAVMAAAQGPVVELLRRLPAAWRLLGEEAEAMRREGWPPPLALPARRLPLFRLAGSRRVRLAAGAGGCPREVLREVEAHPHHFTPNVWLRPLVQDAALHTSAALLGAAELAYHLQGKGLWELAGLARPQWRLRPHITVVTAAERRLIRQLGVEPAHVVGRRFPSRALPGGRVLRQQAALEQLLARRWAALEATVRRELPSLTGDVAATAARVTAALQWLTHRTELARLQGGQVRQQRWRRLAAFLRPEGHPQERRLSVLAPLLRLGLEWPPALAAALDPAAPGMHLMCWGEGGPW